MLRLQVRIFPSLHFSKFGLLNILLLEGERSVVYSGRFTINELSTDVYMFIFRGLDVQRAVADAMSNSI